MVWRNKFQTPSTVVGGAKNLLLQWQQAQSKTAAANIANRREGSVSWEKPPPGWVTCNVDAATFKDRNYSSFGYLLRDNSGEFVAGGGGQFLGIIYPKIAEVMAFREALSWLKNLEVGKVCIEMDALSVVQAMRRKKGEDLSYFGSVIADCFTIIQDLRHLISTLHTYIVLHHILFSKQTLINLIDIHVHIHILYSVSNCSESQVTFLSRPLTKFSSEKQLQST